MTVSEITTHVEDYDAKTRSDLQSRCVERLLSQCRKGGLRLVDYQGNLLPHSPTVPIIAPQVGRAVKHMFQIVIRKQNDDYFTQDDLSMTETLRGMVKDRIDLASQGYEGDVVEVALNPTPTLDYTIHCRTGSVTWNTQLVLGQPYFNVEGLNTRGLTYTPPAHSRDDRVLAHLPPGACHWAPNKSSRWTVTSISLEEVLPNLGVVGVSAAAPTQSSLAGSFRDKPRHQDLWARGMFSDKGKAGVGQRS
jgi:hypothetical protein